MFCWVFRPERKGFTNEKNPKAHCVYFVRDYDADDGATGTAGLRVSGAPIQLSVYQGLWVAPAL